jgi:hypothetical protein
MHIIPHTMWIRCHHSITIPHGDDLHVQKVAVNMLDNEFQTVDEKFIRGSGVRKRDLVVGTFVLCPAFRKIFLRTVTKTLQTEKISYVL